MDKGQYAMGGLLTNTDKITICCLVNFLDANCKCEAKILALELVLQYVVEVVGCFDLDLEIQTASSLLETWIRGDKQSSWELCFVWN